jgi:CHAD domain-containing protein
MAKAKEIIGLDCSTDALEGAAKVLRARFDEIIDLQRTSAQLSDVELIHDLRVATRRLRSALRDFMPLLEKESFQKIKKDLKEISDALGQVRDEDVAIESLEKLQEGAKSGAINEQIKAFIQERKSLREAARLESAENFTIEKFIELQEAFSAKIDKTFHSKDSTERVSFKEFGKLVLAKNLREFEDLSSALYQPFETYLLHRLRISAKRLRYAINVFAVCWDEELNDFAKPVAKMQSFLGDTHDCDDWIKFLVLHEENNGLDRNKREMLHWLLSKFFERRNKRYLSALRLWSDWQADYFLARLKAMTL